MPTNPFKPPDTNPSPAGPGAPVKAVLTGLVVDIGGSLAVGIVISILYAVQLKSQGVADDDLREAMSQMPHDSVLYMAGLLMGLALSVLGGFVCARIARRDEYRLGAIMAAGSVVFSLLLGSSNDGSDQMAFLLIASGFGCNMLGVKLGADLNGRADPDQDTSTP